jgi:hypothetical protein
MVAAQASGSYEIAFQASNGDLSEYDSDGNASNTGQTMTSGTGPSIAALSGGGYEIAYQAAPSPAQPVVTTPVTVTVPTPTPTPGSHPGKPSERRLKVRISIAWTWSHSRSRLGRMRVSDLPARGAVAISCRGRGCPRHTLHAGKHELAHLLNSVRGTVYRAGDRIYVTVSAPGYRSERAVFTIRDGALPAVKLLS